MYLGNCKTSRAQDIWLEIYIYIYSVKKHLFNGFETCYSASSFLTSILRKQKTLSLRLFLCWRQCHTHRAPTTFGDVACPCTLSHTSPSLRTRVSEK